MATPNPDESVYITTAKHHDLSDLPPAEIRDGVEAQTSNFYVGGWLPHLDDMHGDPAGHTGQLDITGGQLDVDGYIRMGTRGAHGTINQSGGTVTTRYQVNMAFHPGGSGTYNLSGGAFNPSSVAVGTHGHGEFNMTGGEVNTTKLFIARGYATAPFKVPNSGVVTQTGGVVNTGHLVLGSREESVGAYRVAGDAQVHVRTRFQIGVNGIAQVVQDGGSIDLDWSLYLGQGLGSFGRYTINEGTFRQADVFTHGGIASGVHVGGEGVGELIVGSGAEVDIAGVYEQNGLSTLTIALGGNADRKPISVGQTATFQAGSKLEILLEEGYVPGLDESFALLTAGLGVFDYGLEITGLNASDWILDVGTNSIRVAYVGGNVPMPNPEPNAVVLFAVGGLVVARAVRRHSKPQSNP
jgi:hypothetical protein